MMKLQEVADRIRGHLKRIESDSALNRVNDRGYELLWCSGVSASGARVFVTYVSYQGQSSLTKAEALFYLGMLDAGFVGRHFEAKAAAVTP
jgi:hypothetical protein